MKRLPTTTEITTVATEPCGCDGSGKISYVERDHPDTKIPLTPETYIGPGTTWGSRLCECRKALPPRKGQVRWWDSKIVFSGEWEASVFEETASVSVRGEVPLSEENYVLIRDEDNVYYPTSVNVEFSCDELRWLFPGEARELAKLLIAAADAADAYDNV